MHVGHGKSILEYIIVKEGWPWVDCLTLTPYAIYCHVCELILGFDALWPPKIQKEVKVLSNLLLSEIVCAVSLYNEEPTQEGQKHSKYCLHSTRRLSASAIYTKYILPNQGMCDLA